MVSEMGGELNIVLYQVIRQAPAPLESVKKSKAPTP